MTDHEWIKPGSEVVLVRIDRDVHRRPTVRRTKVERVAAQSFTVAGCEQRIRLNHLRSADQGSTWNGWHWEVLHPDSERAVDLLAKARRNRSRSKAMEVAEDWLRSDDARRDDLSAIRAVIAALAAHGDLVLTQEAG